MHAPVEPRAAPRRTCSTSDCGIPGRCFFPPLVLAREVEAGAVQLRTITGCDAHVPNTRRCALHMSHFKLSLPRPTCHRLPGLCPDARRPGPRGSAGGLAAGMPRAFQAMCCACGACQVPTRSRCHVPACDPCHVMCGARGCIVCFGSEQRNGASRACQRQPTLGCVPERLAVHAFKAGGCLRAAPPPPCLPHAAGRPSLRGPAEPL